MIAKLKCLGQLLLAIVISLLFLELCECKPDFGVKVIDSVENSDSGNDNIAQAVGPSLVNEDESQAPKRGWSNFNSWGKRGWNNNFAAWGKRDPNNEFSSQNFAQADPEKRGWSNFASWGKRDEGDGSVEALDKRKWNNFHSWGKRNQEDFQGPLDVDKKWSQFASWGKREDDDTQTLEKRKWSQFNSWGRKRSPENMDGPGKWSQFATWGKRSLENSGDYAEPEQLYIVDGNGMSSPVDKRRRWSQFASWGKRLRKAKTLAALNKWGKRRWPGLVTWGKRSSDMSEPNTTEIAQRLLQFFDVNGR